MIRVIRAARIHDGVRFHQNAELLVDDGVVVELRDRGEADETPVLDLGGHSLWPGLVDVQVNGGGGVLVNDGPTPELLEAMSVAHASIGTHSIVPTLITSEPQDRQAAVEAFRTARARLGAARLPALHFEGPFISELKRGIHPLRHIAHLDDEGLRQLVKQAAEVPLVLTLAPECVTAAQVRALVASGAVVSLGHSNGSYEEAREAFAAGASLTTHLFNGMSGVTARDAGVVGAALLHSPYCGLIYDGHHVSSASAQIAVRQLGERVVLVSDCLAPPGGGGDAFVFADRELRVSGGVCVAADGTLGGAAVGLLHCVRNAAEDGVMSVEAAVRAATSAAADAIGAVDLGRIHPGSPADGIVVDENLRLVGTLTLGEFEAAGKPLR